MSLRKRSAPTAAAGRFFADQQTTDALVRRQGDRYTLEILPPSTEPPPAVRWGLVPDALTGISRRLDLPPADPATTRRLVDVQMEQQLPGQADHLTWSSRPLPDDAGRLVSAVATRRLDQLSQQSRLPRAAEAVLTLPFALLEVFALWGRPDQAGPLDLIVLQDHRLHLLLDLMGPGASLISVDLDPADVEGFNDAVAAEITRQRTDLDSTVLPTPRRLVLLIEDLKAPETSRQLIEQAWGQPAIPLSDCLELPDAEHRTLRELAAAGGAAAVLRESQAMNLLAHRGDNEIGHGGGHVTLPRWIAAAVLLLLAVAAYITADTLRARTVTQAVADAGLERQQQQRLDTELAVARYLETSGPGILPILDELSRLTSGFMIDDLRYERSGQFILRATSRSADDINRLARDLSNMKTLDSVRIRSQNAKGRDEIEYTLVASPASDFQLAVVPPPAPSTPADDRPDPSPAPPQNTPSAPGSAPPPTASPEAAATPPSPGPGDAS